MYLDKSAGPLTISLKLHPKFRKPRVHILLINRRLLHVAHGTLRGDIHLLHYETEITDAS